MTEPKLSDYEVSAERGFLASPDPIAALPAPFAAWDALGADLPRLLAADQLRPALDALEVIDPAPLESPGELARAMMLISFLGQAYVWGSGTPVAHIPAGVAVPWHALAERLGRPPILSYASYNMANWRRIDPAGPIALGNLAVRQSFYGGLDEAWFTLVHVAIEAAAGPGLAAIFPAQAAAARGDAPALAAELATITAAVERMDATLARMPERCDPYIYYHRVRPYMFGWKGNPALPGGVVYRGVAALGERPVELAGETGAQSTIVPALDAALGVRHADDPLRPYLLDMLRYAPPAHRAFIAAIEGGPSLREAALRLRDAALTAAYNAAVAALERFRGRHLEYAARYIVAPGRKAGDAAEQGTGGTPFMVYLKKHRDETSAHLIGE